MVFISDIIYGGNKMEKTCGIYCIENIINNKKYIGQSNNIKLRWNSHKRELKNNISKSVYLQNAWNFYGETSFSFYILETCDIDKMDEKEIMYIKKYKSHFSESGYNISWGGNAPLKGVKHSLETRIKQSKVKKEAAKYGKDNHSFGKHHSDETKLKLSLINKGRVYTKERNLKISKSHLGILHSEFTKNKISKSQSREKKNNSSSVYFGVYFHKKVNRWETSFREKGRSVYVGIYKTEIEAAIAHDKYVTDNNIERPLNFPYERRVNDS